MIINLDRSGRVRLQRQRTYETEDADVFVVAQVERREAEEEQERHQNLKASQIMNAAFSAIAAFYQKDSHDDGVGAEPGDGVCGLLLDCGRDEDAVHDDLEDEDNDDGHVEVGEGRRVAPAALDRRRGGVPANDTALKDFFRTRIITNPILSPAEEQRADEGVDDAHDDGAGPEREAEAAAVVRPDEDGVAQGDADAAARARAGVGVAVAVCRDAGRHPADARRSSCDCKGKAIGDYGSRKLCIWPTFYRFIGQERRRINIRIPPPSFVPFVPRRPCLSP